MINELVCVSEQRGGMGEKSFTTGHTAVHFLDCVDYFLPPSKSHMIRDAGHSLIMMEQPIYLFGVNWS